ncbi:MAG: nucleotidyl transferase AbiEii/AbiGii toxin family protein [Bdellovibrionales bacterium]|nr:nucleotidyl transferase AbiEii/AbiGii toxin family protein [Bdellovibrionales bacterium]
MNRFIQADPKTQKLYYEQTASKINLPTHMIEKDFWVCWTLKTLFSLDELNKHLTFKGGTSLSKVFGLIERFSEDIDLSIEKSFLGFHGELDPANAPSNKKRQALIKDLGDACRTYVQNTLQTMLEKEISSIIPSEYSWVLKIDPDDPDQQSLIFEYPKIIEASPTYVKSSIKIEMGARAEHWPVGIYTITPYVTELKTDILTDMDTNIRTLNVERTFWEKATILHMYAHYPEGKIVPTRQSRHFYDFYRLLNSEAKDIALENKDLLSKVAQHKMLYYPAKWANYEAAEKEALRLIPQAEVVDQLEKDYRQMSDMIYGEIPSWKNILSEIQSFEKQFNK